MPIVFDMYIIVLFRECCEAIEIQRGDLHSMIWEKERRTWTKERKSEVFVWVLSWAEQNTESCRGVVEEKTNEQNRSGYEGLQKASCLSVCL